jgi:glycosyltransferase involved in cell wall biosynthesis
MENWQFRFTVFTPTYNRANTLHRVFDSLKLQTFRNFEWLIIDDGSTDNTKERVEEYQRSADFVIRYYFQENLHKFLTLVKAFHLANGEFFYTVDSDDEIVPTALELLNNTWVGITENHRHQFSGVTALCVDQFGAIIGSGFPKSPFDSDSLETYVKYKIKGEKSGFQKTSLLRQFQFDLEYGNNGYIPEGLLWVGLANKGYKTRYINEVVRKYYVAEGPSIMTNAAFKPNAFGTFQFTKLFLNSYRPYYLTNLPLVIGQIRKFTATGWYFNLSTHHLFKQLNVFIIRMLFILSLPISWFYSKNITKT